MKQERCPHPVAPVLGENVAERRVVAYRVLRHGGRRDSQWRVILEAEDKARVLARYEQEVAKLRQGWVRLEAQLEDGLWMAIKGTWAPRLRTRW